MRDSISNKLPSLVRILERRSAIAVLLVVAIFLLVGDAFELITKEIPEETPTPIVKIGSPPPPTDSHVSPEIPKGTKGSPPTKAQKVAIRIASEKEVASANPELPWGLEVTLVSDEDVSPVALTIKFSGEVGKFYASAPGNMVQEQQGGILVSKPDTILMQWQSPPFTPQQPIIVTVYSKLSLKAKKIESIPFNFPYPEGYLK
jgi:hypothetical protein